MAWAAHLKALVPGAGGLVEARERRDGGRIVVDGHARVVAGAVVVQAVAEAAKLHQCSRQHVRVAAAAQQRVGLARDTQDTSGYLRIGRKENPALRTTAQQYQRSSKTVNRLDGRRHVLHRMMCGALHAHLAKAIPWQKAAASVSVSYSACQPHNLLKVSHLAAAVCMKGTATSRPGLTCT